MKMAKEYGIHTGELSVDYKQMKNRKDSVVQKLRGGIEGLLKANKVTFFSGHAKFVSPKEIKVGEEQLLKFEKSDHSDRIRTR